MVAGGLGGGRAVGLKSRSSRSRSRRGGGGMGWVVVGG